MKKETCVSLLVYLGGPFGIGQNKKKKHAKMLILETYRKQENGCWRRKKKLMRLAEFWVFAVIKLSIQPSGATRVNEQSVKHKKENK